jgi:ADP-ribose pyrophosphatase YjhB (NUDIX family)
MVVGCVIEYEGLILLCRRAIEPRYNYWTVPAGFMELGETIIDAAARETREEACAEITIGGLLAVVDAVHAGQAHIFFRGTLKDGIYGVGEESLDTQLFHPDQIPWDEIAFPSGTIALKRYIHFMKTGDSDVHYTQAEPLKRL